MKRVYQLIHIDYANYKKLFFHLLLSVGVLMIFINLVTAFDIRSQLYTYHPASKTYTLSSVPADRPEEYLSSIFTPQFLTVFVLLSSGLSLFFCGKVYIERSIYVIHRLPQTRWIYYLSKYLPSLALLWIGYLFGMIQLLLFYVMYQLFIPASCLPSDCWHSFLTSRQVMQYYPVANPVRFIPLLLLGLLLPALGLLVFEAPRSLQRFLAWCRLHFIYKRKKGDTNEKTL